MRTRTATEAVESAAQLADALGANPTRDALRTLAGDLGSASDDELEAHFPDFGKPEAVYAYAKALERAGLDRERFERIMSTLRADKLIDARSMQAIAKAFAGRSGAGRTNALQVIQTEFEVRSQDAFKIREIRRLTER